MQLTKNDPDYTKVLCVSLNFDLYHPNFKMLVLCNLVDIQNDKMNLL